MWIPLVPNLWWAAENPENVDILDLPSYMLLDPFQRLAQTEKQPLSIPQKEKIRDPCFPRASSVSLPTKVGAGGRQVFTSLSVTCSCTHTHTHPYYILATQKQTHSGRIYS